MPDTMPAHATPSYIFELEQGLLWMLIHYKTAETEIAAYLTPNCFSVPEHRVIAECIYELSAKNQNCIDELIVKQALAGKNY